MGDFLPTLDNLGVFGWFSCLGEFSHLFLLGVEGFWQGFDFSLAGLMVFLA